MKTKILLVTCMLLLVSTVNARDFVVYNSSDDTQPYFTVNGTTGNIDVPGSGFFGCDGNVYKLCNINEFTGFNAWSIFPGDLRVARCFFYSGGGFYG